MQYFLSVILISMLEPSIFTRIIKGEIPCHKIYEDAKTLEFLDIFPSSEGHTLVISKKQVEFLWDLEDEDYQALMATVKKVGRQLREKLDAPYVGIKVVGIDVPHVHVHLVPFANVTEYNRSNTSEEPNHEELAKIAARLAF